MSPRKYKALIMKRFCVLIVSILSIVYSTFSQSVSKPFTQTGKASFYADKFHGKRTSSGEKFDMNSYTAAHKTLKFGTLVKVTNKKNGKAVIVRINDRGPYVKSRVLDLSKAAAKSIDLIRSGGGWVLIEEVDELLASVGPVVGSGKPLVELNDATVYEPGNTYNVWGQPLVINKFSIQLSAFTDILNAQEFCRELLSKGIEQVFIQVGMAQDTKIFKVLVYDLETRSDAVIELKNLKLLGFSGFVKNFES